MLPKGNIRKTYLAITLVITFSTIVTMAVFIENKRTALIERKHLQLLRIASALERTLDSSLFAAEIEQVDALVLSQDEKAAIINRKFQPVLIAAAHEFPGSGLGIYARRLERVVAASPEIPASRLRQFSWPEALKVYETKQPVFAELEISSGWGGKRMYNLAYPIIYSGQVIGYTWTTAKIEEFESEFQAAITVIVIAGISLWGIGLFTAGLVLRKLENGLKQLVHSLQEQIVQEDVSSGFPEIQPLLQEIGALRLALQREYEQREEFQKEIEQLDRINIVGEMAAGIGHEVRNPLTTIRGYLQLLKGKKEFEKYDGQFNTMIEELDRASHIITEFLSLAKDTRDGLKRGNLNTVIVSLLPLLQADAYSRGHELQIEAGMIQDSEIDEKEIRQLILNLVRNGFEAMEQCGEVVIRTYQENENIILEVQDTGTGIPAEVMDRLGTPFMTTKTNGTGLGIPVCYRIVERHGAKIAIDTGPQGTTFAVVFNSVPQHKPAQ